MKIIHIRGDQLRGGNVNTDTDDYYTLLTQLPDCMYFFVDSSIPVTLNNETN